MINKNGVVVQQSDRLKVVEWRVIKLIDSLAITDPRKEICLRKECLVCHEMEVKVPDAKPDIGSKDWEQVILLDSRRRLCRFREEGCTYRIICTHASNLESVHSTGEKLVGELLLHYIGLYSVLNCPILKIIQKT